MHPVAYAAYSLWLFPLYVFRMMIGGDIDEIVLRMIKVHPDPAWKAQYPKRLETYKMITAERKKLQKK